MMLTIRNVSKHYVEVVEYEDNRQEDDYGNTVVGMNSCEPGRDYDAFDSDVLAVEVHNLTGQGVEIFNHPEGETVRITLFEPGEGWIRIGEDNQVDHFDLYPGEISIIEPTQDGERLIIDELDESYDW